MPASAQATPTSIESLVPIVKFLISNCLSYGVVVGASILKVPQILAIQRQKKADGISLTANYVELFSYVISTSWGIVQGLQFRDYGENVFIFAQLIVLVLMVARMQRKLPSALVVLLMELCTFLVFAAGYLPTPVHQTLLSSQILLNIGSRVPQIRSNLQNHSTGTLSFLTFFLAFGGGVARVLTTALNVPWEKGKAIMLTQYTVAATLNLIIILQILFYKNRKDTKGMTKKA
ncbi:mannose-P-dolichol utilization defect 1 [Strigomonas culicis]|uniref:Mannose-P-dolichol utilization defect 1 protein homolog n=1 Tax=Strigomonas culicis TaxID=28005 RepID=S9VQL9_9TRYP|nr:mannose-P-dolichol utilization defect 1 [Strigomonas culicis]EPY29416.1 mannose-P-dolichol utilization defect 1 [Strigomonas culicis]EPY36305.1 mannose-P-dolichol utilization defect 1 [Strigomonas culicis]|eukprot:EPY26281.1 mannose-P-dolichol utilization defect 1 [Strigomonas culicis]